jgi:hypothetical protein
MFPSPNIPIVEFCMAFGEINFDSRRKAKAKILMKYFTRSGKPV